MKDAASPRPIVDGRIVAPRPNPDPKRSRGRGPCRRAGGGRRGLNHRTPLEDINVSVAGLVDHMVEEEFEAVVGPELLDPAFDAAEDLGSFVKLSVVTTALCGTWASWVADDMD